MSTESKKENLFFLSYYREENIIYQESRLCKSDRVIKLEKMRNKTGTFFASKKKVAKCSLNSKREMKNDVGFWSRRLYYIERRLHRLLPVDCSLPRTEELDVIIITGRK